MRQKHLLLVWLASLLAVGTAAAFFRQPGYMDAYYYYHVAANLAAGQGLVEDFVWNYLVPFQTIPHPSNLYWMPLTSFVSAPFLALFGPSFRAAQVPLLLLASLVPPMTALVGWDLWRDLRLALAAAALTLFGGYYFLYWTVIDSFAPFSLAATIGLWATARFLWQAGAPLRPEAQAEAVASLGAVKEAAYASVKGDPRATAARAQRPGAVAPPLPATTTEAGLATGPRSYPLWLLGAIAGSTAAAAHLARADGFLVLVASLAACLLVRKRGWQTVTLSALGTYAVAMGPWLLRTWQLTGSVAAPGAATTIFLQDYNDFFSYNQETSLAAYLAWGLGPVFQSKLRAFAENLVVLYGSGFMLLPFGLLGAWQLRRDRRLLPFFLYALLLYFFLTLVFTFPGARGSMRHSGVALLPWTAVLAIHGIRTAVAWGARRWPHWNVSRAKRGFTAVAVGASIVLSLIMLAYNAGVWDQEWRHYQALARWLDDQGASSKPVMVTNPPAFFYASGRQGVVTPSDGPEALALAADAYGVEYVALEAAHAPSLTPLYQGAVDVHRLEPVEWVGTTRMFKVLR